MTAANAMWNEYSRRELIAAIAGVRTALMRYAALRGGVEPPAEAPPAEMPPAEAPPAEAEHPEIPSTLDTLCTTFDLFPFERAVLVACAGIELDDELAQVVGQLSGNGARALTFGIALNALPDAHWRALIPAG